MNQKNNEGFRDVYLLRIRVKTFILISWSYFSSFSNQKVSTNIIRQEKKWLYIIQSQINESGAWQYPLTRPPSPRLKKQQTEAYLHEKSGIYLYF